MQKKVKLQKTNAITVFGAGHQALAEIEGLRRHGCSRNVF